MWRFAALPVLGILCCCALALSDPPATPPTSKRVAIEATDGHYVYADYYAPSQVAPPAPLVILVHGYQHDRQVWSPLITPLYETGFAILAIDLRGHGESSSTETRALVEQREKPLFREMRNDVCGAYLWAVEQPGVDRARIALVGEGVGGTIALAYAAEDRSVDAIVCLSPGLDHVDLDPRGDLRQVKGRKLLLVGGKRDHEVCDAMAPLTTGVSKHYIDAPHRGAALFAQEVELASRVVSFVERAVGQHSTRMVYASIRSNVYHQPDSGWIDRISRSNLRAFSSGSEAKSRGLRAARSKGPSDKPWKRRKKR